MTDIGDPYHEYDGGKGSGSHNTVDGPSKSTTRVSNTDEGDGNAAFDNDGTRSVEKLSNEEELSAMISFSLEFFT